MDESTEDDAATRDGFELQLHESVDRLVEGLQARDDEWTQALPGPGCGVVEFEDSRISHVLDRAGVPATKRYCALSPLSEITLRGKLVRRRYSTFRLRVSHSGAGGHLLL